MDTNKKNIKDYNIAEFVNEIARLSNNLKTSYTPHFVIGVGAANIILFFISNYAWGTKEELSLLEGIVLALGGVLVLAGLIAGFVDIKRNQEILKKREEQLHEQIMMNKYNIQEIEIKKQEEKLNDQHIKKMELEKKLCKNKKKLEKEKTQREPVVKGDGDSE